MSKFDYISALTVSAIICGLCGYLLWQNYGLCAIAAYVGIVLGFPFSYIIHEFGHVLFGAICKIKVIPSFHILKSDYCKIQPKTDKNLKPRIVLTSLGGLIINLIFFVLGVLALNTVLPAWLCVILPSSFYVIWINAACTYSGVNKTDMDVCVSLLSGSDEGKVMLAVLTIQAQLYCGKRIEEIDEDLLFKVPQIREDNESFIALTELRYEYVKAKEGEEAAKPYLERFESLKEYL